MSEIAAAAALASSDLVASTVDVRIQTQAMHMHAFIQ